MSPITSASVSWPITDRTESRGATFNLVLVLVGETVRDDGDVRALDIDVLLGGLKLQKELLSDERACVRREEGTEVRN